jgi:2',3'-cyclic-nucleotide 2'-phosphodiesterase (5'-nucleotidase family)
VVVAVVDIDLKTVESRGKSRFEWDPKLRFVRTDAVQPDPEIAAIVKRYEDQLSAELDQPLGVTETLLDSRRGAMRSAENALGNLIADAIRTAVDADVALTNSGGIRGDRTYEPGHSLTRRDILTELPFGNRTVKLEISGAQVRQMLEHGFSVGDTGGGRFPQVSGISVVWNPKAAVGARVVEIKVGGQPLDPAQRYTIATNDFLAKGGDGYKIFAGLPRLIDPASAQLMAGQVMAYVTAQGKVAPKVEGRITATQ